MTKPLLIKNGHLIDPARGLDETCSILLADGRIAWLGGEKTPPTDYNFVDAGGFIVCPGFIDLHCHLREPGYEEKETIATGSRAAARGGFATVCCMPNTDPPLDNRATIDYVKSIATNQGVVRVLPIGTITKDRQGQELAEMAEMAEAGAIAFSDDGRWVTDSRLMRQAMEYSRAFNRPIISHCQDTNLTEDGQMNEGITATRLGLRGIPAAAEELAVARDIALAELTNCRLHIAHISTAGSVELIRRAKDKGIRITCEVTPHHLTLTEDRVMGYDTNAKINPPLRIEADIQALIEGLNEGVIDIIATDHAPHTENDKLCEFALAPFGFSNLETALGSLMGLVHDGKLPLGLLISKLTATPAGIIGPDFGRLGTLEEGAAADVTIFSPDAEWTVDTSQFASKGHNTPLEGSHLKGRVMATIYNGKLAYQDTSIKAGATNG
jgi:dihydroorotase